MVGGSTISGVLPLIYQILAVQCYVLPRSGVGSPICRLPLKQIFTNKCSIMRVGSPIGRLPLKCQFV